jgi:hypothetical protein
VDFLYRKFPRLSEQDSRDRQTHADRVLKSRWLLRCGDSPERGIV